MKSSTRGYYCLCFIIFLVLCNILMWAVPKVRLHRRGAEKLRHARWKYLVLASELAFFIGPVRDKRTSIRNAWVKLDFPLNHNVGIPPFNERRVMPRCRDARAGHTPAFAFSPHAFIEGRISNVMICIPSKKWLLLQTHACKTYKALWTFIFHSTSLSDMETR